VTRQNGGGRRAPGRVGARRRLGQHFLTDPAAAARIVAVAELDGRPPVLEIGPGKGALTDRLRQATDCLYLVEIDPALVLNLRARYGSDPGVMIIEGDVLDLDLTGLLVQPGIHVVGNLPYSVASQILLRLVELRERCPLAVVMLQEEVARRVAAEPGGRDFGVLTLLVQLYADVERCFSVSHRCFSPAPRVESAVIRLRLRPTPRVAVEDPLLFRSIVRLLFQQRRKMVRNTIGAALRAAGIDPEEGAAVLQEAAIDASARPEHLSLQEFADLTAVVGARRARTM
jgi:16S rRNA (adenine1518-N6/adenine1519-N6)-dimethyltransferase